jgi:hypothetical protein
MCQCARGRGVQPEVKPTAKCGSGILVGGHVVHRCAPQLARIFGGGRRGGAGKLLEVEGGKAEAPFEVGLTGASAGGTDGIAQGRPQTIHISSDRLEEPSGLLQRDRVDQETTVSR